MNVRSIIGAAALRLDTHKNPNIDAEIEILDVILEAAGQPTIGNDHVESIHIGETVDIRTRYVVRGCENENEMSFPASILDEPNPVRAAKAWKYEKDFIKLTAQRKEAIARVDYYNQLIENLQAEQLKFLGEQK